MWESRIPWHILVFFLWQQKNEGKAITKQAFAQFRRQLRRAAFDVHHEKGPSVATRRTLSLVPQLINRGQGSA